MARPKLIGVGTKSQFRRAVPKSYSYRYEVGSASGPGDAPQVSAVIETRYRGKAASWNLSRSMMSKETWTLNGTFIAPAPENPMTYPAKEPTAPVPVAPPAAVAPPAVAPTAAVAAAASPAPPPPSARALSAASNARRAISAPPPVAPVSPAAVTPARTIPRADPAVAPNAAAAAAAERIFSFSRKLTATPKRNVG